MTTSIIIIIIIIITSAKVEVTRPGRFVCHLLSAYVQDYCKSNQSISMKLAVMIEPTNRKNWLTFGGDPVSDADSESLFHFPHHCGMGDFKRSIKARL